MAYAHKDRKTGLTKKQEAFVQAYIGKGHGDVTRSAEIAGYEANSKESFMTVGRDLLRKPHVVAEIKRLRDERVRADTLTRVERLKHLTDIVLNPNAKDADRIRAIEVLCKMEGDFIERRLVESKTEVSFADRRRAMRVLLGDEEAIAAARLLAERTKAANRLIEKPN